MITVLLPIYNTAAFVDISIKSILKQSFKEFELLVIDDASTDGSVDRINRYKDSRIRLLCNDNNIGVAKTLNRGIDMARGAYIARMDADDVCYSSRLMVQKNFLDRNPNVGFCGSWVRLFGDQPRVVVRQPVESETIKVYMLFDNPFCHPSVMMRKALLDHYALRYDAAQSRSEDFDLWIRSSRFCEMANIPQPLVRLRVHGGNITSGHTDVMASQSAALLRSQLQDMGIFLSDEQAINHFRISRGYRLLSCDALLAGEQWLQTISKKISAASNYSDTAIMGAVGMIWFRLCLNSAALGMDVHRIWRGSALAAGCTIHAGDYLQFVAKILWNRIRS